MKRASITEFSKHKVFPNVLSLLPMNRALSTESPEYAIYEEMLNKHRPLEKSGESDTDAFERLIKNIVKEPGQM